MQPGLGQLQVKVAGYRLLDEGGKHRVVEVAPPPGQICNGFGRETFVQAGMPTGRGLLVRGVEVRSHRRARGKCQQPEQKGGGQAGETGSKCFAGEVPFHRRVA